MVPSQLKIFHISCLVHQRILYFPIFSYQSSAPFLAPASECIARTRSFEADQPIYSAQQAAVSPQVHIFYPLCHSEMHKTQHPSTLLHYCANFWFLPSAVYSSSKPRKSSLGKLLKSMWHIFFAFGYEPLPHYSCFNWSVKVSLAATASYRDFQDLIVLKSREQSSIQSSFLIWQGQSSQKHLSCISSHHLIKAIPKGISPLQSWNCANRSAELSHAVCSILSACCSQGCGFGWIFVRFDNSSQVEKGWQLPLTYKPSQPYEALFTYRKLSTK